MLAKQRQARFILDFRAPRQVNSFFYYLRINFSMQLQFSFFFDDAVTVSIFSELLFMQLQFFFAGVNSA